MANVDEAPWEYRRGRATTRMPGGSRDNENTKRNVQDELSSHLKTLDSQQIYNYGSMKSQSSSIYEIVPTMPLRLGSKGMLPAQSVGVLSPANSRPSSVDGPQEYQVHTLSCRDSVTSLQSESGKCSGLDTLANLQNIYGSVAEDTDDHVEEIPEAKFRQKAAALGIPERPGTHETGESYLYTQEPVVLSASKPVFIKGVHSTGRVHSELEIISLYEDATPYIDGLYSDEELGQDEEYKHR